LSVASELRFTGAAFVFENIPPPCLESRTSFFPAVESLFSSTAIFGTAGDFPCGETLSVRFGSQRFKRIAFATAVTRAGSAEMAGALYAFGSIKLREISSKLLIAFREPLPKARSLHHCDARYESLP
jgi:hypothetical protein